MLRYRAISAPSMLKALRLCKTKALSTKIAPTMFVKTPLAPMTLAPMAHAPTIPAPTHPVRSPLAKGGDKKWSSDGKYYSNSFSSVVDMENWFRVRFVLSPEAILRNERHYQNRGLRFVFLARTDFLRVIDEVAFNLLKFLAFPRSYDELRCFYFSQCQKAGMEQSEKELASLLIALVEGEVVELTEEGEPVKPIRLPKEEPPEFPSPFAPFSFPVHVSLALTGACNLRCRHCMAAFYPKTGLSLDQLADIFEQLDEGGAFSLKLTGGEPMVYHHFWDALKLATSHRFSVGLLTNLTLLDEKGAERLGEIAKRKGHGFVVGTSLDGADAETHDWMRQVKGSFNKTLRAMHLLKEAKVPFIVQCSLNQKNKTQLREIANLCFEHGARTVYFLVPCQLGRAPKELTPLSLNEIFAIRDEVEQMAKETGWWIEFDPRHTPMHGAPSDGQSSDEVEVVNFPPKCCPAGITVLSISSTGKVYPCIDAMDSPLVEMGDVTKESIADIWRSEKWNFFRGGIDEREIRARACKGCPWFEQCGYKFCRAYPAAAMGDLYACKPECLLYRKDLKRNYVALRRREGDGKGVKSAWIFNLERNRRHFAGVEE